MTLQNFTIDIDADGIALVTWNMPGRSMNVIDMWVLEELSAIVEQVVADAAIKAVVLTSSSWACATPIPNIKYHIDSDLWNEEAVKAAWAPPPYEQDRLMAVYAASKVEGEKACWKFMEENRPGFAFNTGKQSVPVYGPS